MSNRFTGGDGQAAAARKAKRDALRAEAIAAGHKKRSPMKVIRAKCLDCCCFQAAEVRDCPAKACPNWPYRFGTNPFYGDEASAPADAKEQA